MPNKSIKLLLQELNPAQREAVEARDGPVLILAGAGSGKTRVLTFRIAYLLESSKALPHQILAMTFTNKAAEEMKERVKRFTNLSKDIWIGTFHSIFLKILRYESSAFGFGSDFVIYDTQDQLWLIKSILDDMNILPKQFTPQAVLATISLAKNRLVTPDEYVRKQNNSFEKAIARIYPEYQNHLRANHAFDFDDLITVPIQLFLQHSEILEKYQSRFKYILVDEYQDTNLAQYRLIQLLSMAHRNLYVVGDDDQSIYSWRGANINNILNFESDFPDSKVFRLEQNYRSTQTILSAAVSMVKNNVGRKTKTLWSEQAEGEKVEIVEVADEREEAIRMVEKIQDEVFKNKRTFREFAVLYRTNAQSRALEDGLRRIGFSYVIIGGVRFYERKEIKDILAYLKCIVNPMDSVSLKRIINFPLRGIGGATLKKVEIWSKEKGIDLFEAIGKVEQIQDIPNRIKNSIMGFYQLIQKYIDLKDKISLNELVHTLVDEAGILLIYKEDTSVVGQGRADNIRELLSSIDEYTSTTEEPTLFKFINEISLITNMDEFQDRDNAVTLMTLHSAKGLEFPVVFITGLEEGLLPISKSLDEPEALEEERRLFYVGLTRAKEKVYLMWAKRRSRFTVNNYCLPSRFLEELESSFVERLSFTSVPLSYEGRERFRPARLEQCDPHPDYESFSQEVPVLKSGTWVRHNMYGKGQVVLVEGMGSKQKVSVMFTNGIEKKFVTQYAKFSIL